MCAFSLPAVSHEVTSYGREHHGSALYGRAGGFLTAAGLRGEPARTRSVSGGRFRSFIAPFLAVALNASQPTEIFPKIWRRRFALSAVRYIHIYVCLHVAFYL